MFGDDRSRFRFVPALVNDDDSYGSIKTITESYPDLDCLIDGTMIWDGLLTRIIHVRMIPRVTRDLKDTNGAIARLFPLGARLQGRILPRRDEEEYGDVGRRHVEPAVMRSIILIDSLGRSSQRRRR